MDPPAPGTEHSRTVTPAPGAEHSRTVTPAPGAEHSRTVTPASGAEQSRMVTPAPAADPSITVTPPGPALGTECSGAVTPAHEARTVPPLELGEQPSAVTVAPTSQLSSHSATPAQGAQQTAMPAPSTTTITDPGPYTTTPQTTLASMAPPSLSNLPAPISTAFLPSCGLSLSGGMWNRRDSEPSPWALRPDTPFSFDELWRPLPDLGNYNAAPGLLPSGGQQTFNFPQFSASGWSGDSFSGGVLAAAGSPHVSNMVGNDFATTEAQRLSPPSSLGSEQSGASDQNGLSHKRVNSANEEDSDSSNRDAGRGKRVRIASKRADEANAIGGGGIQVGHSARAA